MSVSSDWAHKLRPTAHWRDAYKAVAQVARLHLETRTGDDPPLSTSQLIETLWPAHQVRGDDEARARQRMFRALFALAEHDLADVATRGDPVVTRNGEIRPWLWTAPAETPRPTCPHCGGVL